MGSFWDRYKYLKQELFFMGEVRFVIELDKAIAVF